MTAPLFPVGEIAYQLRGVSYGKTDAAADVAKYVDAMNELRATYDIQKCMWFISKRLISDSGFNGDDVVLNSAITHYGTSCLISTVKLFRETKKEFSITI